MFLLGEWRADLHRRLDILGQLLEVLAIALFEQRRPTVGKLVGGRVGLESRLRCPAKLETEDRPVDTPASILGVSIRIEGISASRLRVRERCEVLSRVGVVEALSNEGLVWELTGKGKRYLAGEIPRDEFPDPWADGKKPRTWWLPPSL